MRVQTGSRHWCGDGRCGSCSQISRYSHEHSAETIIIREMLFETIVKVYKCVWYRLNHFFLVHGYGQMTLSRCIHNAHTHNWFGNWQWAMAVDKMTSNIFSRLCVSNTKRWISPFELCTWVSPSKYSRWLSSVLFEGRCEYTYDEYCWRQRPPRRRLWWHQRSISEASHNHPLSLAQAICPVTI